MNTEESILGQESTWMMGVCLTAPGAADMRSGFDAGRWQVQNVESGAPLPVV